MDVVEQPLSSVSPTMRKPQRKLSRQQKHPHVMFVLRTVRKVQAGVAMGKREIRNAQYSTGSVLYGKQRFKPRRMKK